MSSLQEIGIYAAGAAAVMVWLLKFASDQLKKSRSKQHPSRAEILARALWSIKPDSRRRTLRVIAWLKLVMIGLMLAGVLLASLPTYLDADISIISSFAFVIAWFGYLVHWKVKNSAAENSKDSEAEDSTKLPVTIITGFLGSGKTTLVNHILKTSGGKEGKKILVIENEVGEEGIDHELLIREGNEEIVLMNNGCVCCSVRGDLVKSVHRLMDDGTLAKLDWVLIETTGIADPAPVAQTLYMDPRCKSKLRLDSVVAVTDLCHVHLRLQEPTGVAHSFNETVEQIAFGDVVVLNKSDLASAQQLRDATDAVHRINPRAAILVTCYAAASLDSLLNLAAFDHRPEAVLPTMAAAEGTMAKGRTAVVHYERGGACGECGERECKKEHGKEGEREYGISTVVVRARGELDFGQFNEWMLAVLQDFGGQILRFKGVCAMKGRDHAMVVQGMHMVFDGRQGSPWPSSTPPGERESRLVFIARGLSLDFLQLGLNACLAGPGGSGTRVFDPRATFPGAQKDAEKKDA